MKKYGFGVDVGGTTVKMGFFETSGELLDKWEIKTDTSDNGKAVLPDIAQAIDNKLAQEGISKSDVEGVGIGVPGPVRSDGVVNGCVNLGWGVINVAEELGAQTGLKVKVGNDANVAGLGEMWQGGGKGSKDVIMVTLGTGVGGGIIVDGHVVAGYNGAGGEIGHITVNHDEIETVGSMDVWNSILLRLVLYAWQNVNLPKHRMRQSFVIIKILLQKTFLMWQKKAMK